jgi:flagellar protein FliL
MGISMLFRNLKFWSGKECLIFINQFNFLARNRGAMLMGKRIINILLIIFIVVLLGGTAYLLINDNSGKSKDKEPSIDEVLEASVHVNDITTNLQDGRYIKLSLTVETDGEEAKQELEKRDFQIRSIILSELADMKSGD